MNRFSGVPLPDASTITTPLPASAGSFAMLFFGMPASTVASEANEATDLPLRSVMVDGGA